MGLDAHLFAAAARHLSNYKNCSGYAKAYLSEAVQLHENNLSYFLDIGLDKDLCDTMARGCFGMKINRTDSWRKSYWFSKSLHARLARASTSISACTSYRPSNSSSCSDDLGSPAFSGFSVSGATDSKRSNGASACNSD